MPLRLPANLISVSVCHALTPTQWNYSCLIIQWKRAYARSCTLCISRRSSPRDWLTEILNPDDLIKKINALSLSLSHVKSYCDEYSAVCVLYIANTPKGFASIGARRLKIHTVKFHCTFFSIRRDSKLGRMPYGVTTGSFNAVCWFKLRDLFAVGLVGTFRFICKGFV